MKVPNLPRIQTKMQPNYLKIVNHFWEVAPYQEGYRSQHPALFFAILNQVNKNNWRKTKIDLGLMLCLSGLSKPTYQDARKWLVKNGWVNVVEGRNAYQSAEFSLGVEVRIEDIVEDNIFTPTHTSTLSSTPPSTHTSTLPIYNKPVNNKPKTYKQEVNSATDPRENKIFDSTEGKPDSEEVPKESPPIPLPPPYNWNTLAGVLKTDRPFTEWAMRELKVDAQKLEDLILDYIVFQHGKGNPINPDYRDLKSHIINHSRVRLEAQNNGNTHKTANNTKRGLKPSGVEPPASGRRFGSWDD